ncbi:hypothetical protein [Antarctobacter jejuensis]|uniref:hypothetical protein n=1 Tax=Antarctobacter jejuensis TaxID=1439938 RepID=UPI003FD3106E
MTRFLERLFAPAPACGPLCRAVEEELSIMRNADTLTASARAQVRITHDRRA